METTIECEPDLDWSLGKAIIKVPSLEDALRVVEETSGKEWVQGAKGPLQVYIPNEECKRLGIPEMDPKANRKVVVNNIPRKLTEANLKQLFGRYGKVESIDLHQNVPYNMCDVIYGTQEAANTARTNMGFIYQQFSQMTPPQQVEEHKVNPLPISNRAVPEPLIEPRIEPIVSEPRMMPPRSAERATERPSDRLTEWSPTAQAYAAGGYAQPDPSYQRYYPSGAPPQTSQIPPNQPPLQQVFIEYFSADGTPYYYNALAKSTQWDHPPPNCYIIPSPAQKAEPRPAPSYPVSGPPPAASSPFGKDTRPFRPPHGSVSFTCCD